MTDVDVAILGGGIGGSALGGFLARAGLRVLMLERETVFTGRVRGEWMAPWGVAELRRLGLYERFLAAGGHHLARHIGNDELVPTAEASANPLPIDALLPGVSGLLCVEHVVMQHEALAQAILSGVELCRGVTDVWVCAGSDSRAALRDGGAERTVNARLIEGADGWPQDLQAGGAERMLAAFATPCVPNSDAIAAARPAGPCRTFPSQDAWIEEPYCGGAVLIGDAAGHNDPIIGQGLSIPLRDARIVGEILTGSEAWSAQCFEPYASERRERLLRLRASAIFATSLNARFEPRDLARRAAAIGRIAADPSLLMPLVAISTGPETVTAGFFSDAFHERVFAANDAA